MKKITVLIDNNTILFKYRRNKPTEPNLLNTNVISNNELVFSDDYLINNKNIVRLFIHDLISEKNVNKIVISSIDLANIVLELLENNKEIQNLTITDEAILTYELCEKIIQNKNIKNLSCYSIPQFMIEKLDKQGILVESRNEVLFTSNFMAENNLTSFSKIYYKTSIKISDDLSTDDIEDIKTFLTINKYIKVIYLDKYSLDMINTLVDLLIQFKEKNILIELHEDIDDADDVVNLKAINKMLKKYKLKITLVYSKDYVETNYLQQVIFTTLKICAMIIFAIVASVLGYITYNNHQSELKDNEIKDNLQHLIEEENKEQETKPSDNGVQIDEDKLTLESYKVLKQVNSNMVGWVTVKGTKIDYPVVKGSDNDYYLRRNFYKEKDYNGWVFMDYKNNAVNLDANTIIYAHNRYSSGIMFGTLSKVSKKSWYENKENHYITFNTMNKVQKWKVFSYYSIKVTSDYLITNFNTTKEHQAFINKITRRSRKKFDTKVTTKDKILTLSTCYDKDKRFVVHAVLVNEE